MLSNNGLAMEQSTLLQNQYPVEELKKAKLTLCLNSNYAHIIYITHANCDYIKSILAVL